MSRKGFVYKLYCEGINEFYIGSCWDMKDRKKQHKHNCNNPKRNEYNYKVYVFIRLNGGFDNWKFEILVEKEFENKSALKIKEQEYINLLKPSLNMCSAYQTYEERAEYVKVKDAERLKVKIECACGSKTSLKHKSTHEKTKKHQKYLQTINNITYNITNLTNLTINN